MNGRTVAITGVGAISPLGLTAGQLWEGLLSGRCGIDTIRAFDAGGFTCKIAGEVPDYNIRQYLPKNYRKAAKLMCRDIELAIIATAESIADAGIITKAADETKINIDPARAAINFGAGLISAELNELAPAVAHCASDGRFDIHKWGLEGMEMLTPLWLLKYLPNMPACHLSIIHDIQGPSNTITCGEAGGILAISEAAQVIARDSADIAIAGGCEAKVNPIVMLRQCLIKRATSSGNDNPSTACRPFDADASGSAFGEAGAAIILEDAKRAQKRDAKIYAYIAGTGSSVSINKDYQSLEPDGKAITIAIEQALAEAGIGPDDIDLIIPHGTGIACDDMAEAAGIYNALGKAVENIPAWPIKSMVSSTGAASGVIDTIAASLAIFNGRTGPVKNCDKKAENCRLNIIQKPLEQNFRYVLCCSYTFGGQVAALILKKSDNEKQ